MAANGELYLGTLGNEVLLSAFGRKYTIKNERVAREGRAADGTLRRDTVARKKTFVLQYDSIILSELEKIITLYEIDGELSFLDYRGASTHTSYTVLMGDIDYSRLTLNSDGLWEGLTVELKEV
jgi:hypothetical protein